MSSGGPSYGDPDTRTRILAAAWELVADQGSGLTLGDVAQRAGVSRQAVYLHFGDRSGLLVALVRHMDDVLELGEALAHVRAAGTSAELLERTMDLNTRFWAAVEPVALVLQAAQHDDDAVATAWRDRMQNRQAVFRALVGQVAERGDLAAGWTIEDAAGLLYAVAHFDTWRELTHHLDWTDDHYVAAMEQLLRNAFLVA